MSELANPAERLDLAPGDSLDHGIQLFKRTIPFGRIHGRRCGLSEDESFTHRLLPGNKVSEERIASAWAERFFRCRGIHVGSVLSQRVSEEGKNLLEGDVDEVNQGVRQSERCRHGFSPQQRLPPRTNGKATRLQFAQK